jgi:hypothetical protein
LLIQGHQLLLLLVCSHHTWQLLHSYRSRNIGRTCIHHHRLCSSSSHHVLGLHWPILSGILNGLLSIIHHHASGELHHTVLVPFHLSVNQARDYQDSDNDYHTCKDGYYDDQNDGTPATIIFVGSLFVLTILVVIVLIIIVIVWIATSIVVVIVISCVPIVIVATIIIVVVSHTRLAI